MRSIACPNLQLLHIYNAFYGKLSGHDCEDPVTQLRDQIPTCFSKNAPAIIRETCQGQQSCDLYAEDSLYHDPCPTVNKYMFVSFTCQGRSGLSERLKMFEEKEKLQNLMFIKQVTKEMLPQLRHETATAPKIMKAIVCSGQSGSVFCPELKLLRIKTAFYGKEKGRDCLGKQTNDTAPTCYARDTIMTVKNMCEGQQSCDIFSDPLLYGHTLCGENVLKYLKVEYTCEGHSDLTKKLTDRNKAQYAYQSPQQNNLFLRRSTMYYPKQQQYFKQWQSTWPRKIVQNPWKRTQTWPNTPVQQSQIQQALNSWPNQMLYSQRSNAPQPQQVQRPANPWSNQPSYNSQLYTQRSNTLSPWSNRNQQPWSPRQEVSKTPTVTGGFRHSTCDQCNGDCNNYLCYGCGGCQEPPPEQQTYYYPYQRQDAAYHDAFRGNEMALSGLVIYPVPKMPKSMKGGGGQKPHRSTVAKDDDGDDDDDEDDDDDDDDDENEDKKKSKTKHSVKSKKIKRDILDDYFYDYIY
ncbi:uncharacterized protein LOC130622167 isoform X2 [Hydractinia symbiolongicarpus]|nr:uncharacterized protein LOC130622167 isoform X2 [Hydractinia symbiolongicarpus]